MPDARPEHVPLRDELATARERDGSAYLVGEIQLYCEAEGCPAREVTVVIKEIHCSVAVDRVTCPFCGSRLKLHYVRTLDEVNQEDEADARRSVNSQRWKRDHPETLGVPMSAFLDDTLPA